MFIETVFPVWNDLFQTVSFPGLFIENRASRRYRCSEVVMRKVWARSDRIDIVYVYNLKIG